MVFHWLRCDGMRTRRGWPAWARVGTDALRSEPGHLCRLDAAQNTNVGNANDEKSHVPKRWNAGETRHSVRRLCVGRVIDIEEQQ